MLLNKTCLKTTILSVFHMCIICFAVHGSLKFNVYFYTMKYFTVGIMVVLTLVLCIAGVSTKPDKKHTNTDNVNINV